jgi:hypothetical protein
VKRLLLWITPALALAAVVGTIGYRALERRRASRSAGGEGALAEGVADGHRTAHQAAALRAKWSAAAKAARKPGTGTGPAGLAAAVVPESPLPAPTAAKVTPGTVKPEEAAVRHKLEPLVAGRKDTDLAYVVCEPFSPPPKSEGGDEPSAFDTPPKDPAQPVCRAQVKSRDRNTLGQVVREASTLYDGHVAVEVREHMTAFTGVWYEADLRVDTDEQQPVPTDI